MSETARLVTAEELERFPDDGFRYELVEGRVVRMSPVGYMHGRVVMRFGYLLEHHVRAANLGAVLVELGVKLASNPDTVRAPDVAFIRRDRIPSPPPRGFWKGAADLAVEVLSPDDRPSETRTKIDEYLSRGTSVVVVIDPDDQTVSIFRRPDAPVTLSRTDELDLDDVVPRFHCSVSAIFE